MESSQLQENEAGRRIFVDAFNRNMSQIDLIRTVLYLVMGALCGILGLTSVHGLAFYVLMSVVVGMAIAAPMGYDTKTFTNVSLFALCVQGFTGQAMSFIMSWTICYALVYIY